MKQITKDSRINFKVIEKLHLDKYRLKIENELVSKINGSSGNVKKYYEKIKSNLRNLLVGKPNVTEKIIEKLELKKAAINSKEYEDEKVSSSLWGIFDYDNFVDSELPKWGAYKYTEMLNVNTCAYCNRIFSNTIDRIDFARRFNKAKKNFKKKKILNNIQTAKTRPELDHFYPRAKFIYMGLNIYNLVPSCHICNSNLKGSRKLDFEKLINPFHDDFDEIIEIRAEFTDASKINKKILKGELSGTLKQNFGYQLFNNNTSCFELCFHYRNPFEAKKNEKADEHIKLFALKELYDFHKGYVARTIKNAIVYSGSSAIDILNKHPKMFSSLDEVKSTIMKVEINPELINDFPLSKLTIDISKDFGL